MANRHEVLSSFERNAAQEPILRNRSTRRNDSGAQKGASWTVIIIFLFLFFPVGVALMLVKLHKEKDHCVSNGKGTAIVGWVFFAFGIIYTIEGLTGGLETRSGGSIAGGVLMMLILCCGGGIALVSHGGKYKKLGLAYAKYAAVIAESPDGSLDQIAASLPRTYDQTCSDLQELLNAGFFPGCYIDRNSRSFVSPAEKRGAAAENRTANQKSSAPAVIKCPNCGGINAVTDDRAECEYCGSPLR